jgi:phosphatidylinositol alpha-1,6-mannosyltransferase
MKNPTAKHDLLLFAFEYPPVSGGIARLCAEIGSGLAQTHNSARVLTQECAAATRPDGLQEVRVSSKRPLREWRAFQWLRKQQRKTPIICGLWYPEGLIAYLARIRPLIVLAHGAELLPTVDRWRRPLWNALQRLVLENADLVIANSAYTQSLVSRMAPKTQVETIPLAVDPDRFAPADREFAKKKYGVTGKHVLCTVSRIYRYKAHDTVLRAIANLAPSEREQLVYLVVGKGPYERELRKQAAELGIESHVRWLGFISEEELPQVYLASDLFVLCTRDAPGERAVEGFGLVFLEAQSCGTPVVGTRTGGIPAAIRDGEGGWLINQDDSRKLTNIIRQLVHSPELFRQVGVQARKRVLREATWKQYMRQFSALVQTAVATHQAREAGTTAAERLSPHSEEHLMDLTTQGRESVKEVNQRLKSIQLLSRSQLDDLHFDWEVAYASAIKQSLPGSAERETLFAAAYGGLTTILREMRARDGRDLDAPMGFNSAHFNSIVEIAGPAPRTILDVGCSAGTLVRALIAHGYDAYGIDISEDLVSKARELAKNSFGQDLSERFSVGNFLRHDFGNQTFDFIHSNDVLEHIHSDEASAFLSKCRRLMRPGGVLWLITPNRLTGPGDATTLRLPWGTPAIGLHLKEYTLAELSTLLRQANFCQVESRLFGAGRGRRPTKPRTIYARIKRAAEPVLGGIPFHLRRRIMGVFDYSLTIARA